MFGVYQDPCFLLTEIGRTDLLLLFGQVVGNLVDSVGGLLGLGLPF